MLETQLILFSVLVYILLVLSLVLKLPWLITLSGVMILGLGIIQNKITRIYVEYNGTSWVSTTISYTDNALFKIYVVIGVLFLIIGVIETIYHGITGVKE